MTSSKPCSFPKAPPLKYNHMEGLGLEHMNLGAYSIHPITPDFIDSVDFIHRNLVELRVFFRFQKEERKRYRLISLLHSIVMLVLAFHSSSP